MTVLCVPPLEPDGEAWPTLGWAVWDWQLENLVYGPGDLRGMRLREHPPDDEYLALLLRTYEVRPLPEDVAKRSAALRKLKAGELWTPDVELGQAGRRRFKRVGWSLRKGTAKTEKGAWVAAGELHPTAPVRCVGWTLERGEYIPVGSGVRDPYIPIVAYTEEQADELGYGALKAILELSPLADDFDITLERILRADGAGKAESLAAAPSSRDGARTTFQWFDETHHMTLPRLKKARQTMLANTPKRKAADAWTLDTTTAFGPGEDSIAEDTFLYAEQVAEGKIRDSRLFFFHRQASDEHDLATEEGLHAAVVEASGPAAGWSDLDSIEALYNDPDTDQAYFERVWLNRPTQAGTQAFPADRWKLRRSDDAPNGLWVPRDEPMAAGELITLGFDGARTRDSTALIATHVALGWQWPIGIWERPPELRDDELWEIDEDEVDQVVELAMGRYRVWRLLADEPYWVDAVNRWVGRWGEKKVVKFATNQPLRMAPAVRDYREAMKNGVVTHDGDPTFARHIANARKQPIHMWAEDGEQLFVIRKERPDSVKKIDAAMGGCLSWLARGQAIAAGVLRRKKRMYVRTS